MNLINQLSVFQSCESPADVDLSLFEAMPFYVYAKDLQGKYIGMNPAMARDLGLNSADEFLGCEDFDMPFLSFDEATNLRSNDESIIQSVSVNNFIEPVSIFDGTKLNLISYKAPLLSLKKIPIGVIGISLPQNVREFTTLNLTKRQVDCLVNLVKGMTFKQIAKVLNLSPRTIEHHIDAIKRKFKCETRSQLIAKALKIEIIRARL